MISFRFKHVVIDSFTTHLPTQEVTSISLEEKLAPLYKRLQVPLGTLEKVSGIKTRYYWDNKVLPSEVATIAASRAFEGISIPRAEIRALFSCSVTRDTFEPATACIVHRNLGLPEQSLAFDISNACIGFSDGVLMLANLIESGVVPAGVVVSGETVSRIVENNLRTLCSEESLQRDDLLELLPTLTLGSGAAAFVLAHDSLAAKDKPRLLGGALRSATQFNDLCRGDADHCAEDESIGAALMRTESSKIVSSAAKLGARLWPEAAETLQWHAEDIDHIFCHQIGKQVNEAFYKEMGLDYKKEFTIYRKYGNLVSAALPTAFCLGVEEKLAANALNRGDKILLTAFGSGLNSIFLGIQW